MAAGSLPKLIFDVEAYFGSTAVRRMTMAERGVYDSMMFEQYRRWQDRSLPDDPEAVADLIATSDGQRAEILAAWPVVRRKFVADGRRPGRIFNVRVERTRTQQLKNWREIQNRARTAGLASAAKRRKAEDLSLNGRSTDVQQPSTIRERDKTDQKGLERSEKKGHHGHAFCGTRFCVPGFLHEQFDRQLGPRGAAKFDLLAWYPGLDARDSYPIPGNVLTWIQGEFSEATKRLFVDPAQARRTAMGVR